MTRPIGRHRPVHPGAVLRERYLVPLSLSANALALALGVPATRIHEIVNERRSISADTAERLARFFGGDATDWLRLQADYDLQRLPGRRRIQQRVEPRTASGPHHTGDSAVLVAREPSLPDEKASTAISIRDLPQPTLAALREQAAASHRSLEEHVRLLLEREAALAQAGVLDEARAWRERLAGRRLTDVVEEIRADRSR